MILPNNNISIMTVRNCIGCPSTDLGTLIAKAKVGGIGGYAFNIVENGSYTTNGTLIDNAQPYWNIYAYSQPGQWILPASGEGVVKHELKRDASHKYMFSLGSFRNYNTNASAPSPFSLDLVFTKGASFIEYQFLMKVNLGDYDWTNLLGVTHCKMVMYDGASIYAQSTVKPCIRNTTINFENVPIRVPVNYTYEKSYPTRIVLCSRDGNDLGWLPVEGSLNITVTEVPKPYVVSVYVNNDNKVFTVDGVVDTHANATYTGFGSVSADNKVLEKIVYEKVGKQTNAVIQSVTITSFNNLEYPVQLDVYKVGDNESFFFSDQRLYNDNNTYIRVNFYYE